MILAVKRGQRVKVIGAVGPYGFRRRQEGEIRLRDGSVRPTGAEREGNEARSNERGSGAERSDVRPQEQQSQE